MENEKFNDWFDSPKFKAFRAAWEASEKRQNAEDDAWWDSLSYSEKAQAFRQIIKLMYQAEVTDRGTYRWALYDVFGLEYGDGLSHYMRLHNLIYLGLEVEQPSCKKDDKDAQNDGTSD